MGAATVILLATAAAVASVLGGLIALWRKPTTLFMSSVLGLASGVLLATVSLEMVPQSLAKGSLWIAIGGFVLGCSLVYVLDLFIHRGKLAGPASQQRRSVERFYHHRRPRGTEVTVLAAGTSVEELIEGLSIGVGAAIEPTTGMLIAAAIAIDNLSEGMSIGELVLAESSRSGTVPKRRILGWTSTIGAAVLGSAIAGWLLLRGISPRTLAFLIATGAGGMLYLTITKLLPEAEERQYQQSAAIFVTVGFLLILALSELNRAGSIRRFEDKQATVNDITLKCGEHVCRGQSVHARMPASRVCICTDRNGDSPGTESSRIGRSTKAPP